MPRRSDNRERAIETAARLFDRQGFHGTGLAQVVAESSTARGSFYFNFPDGKDELAREAILRHRAQVTQVMRSVAKADDPASVVRGTARALARWLRDSGFVEGCAVASIALDVAADHDELRGACRDAFREWQDELHQRLTAAGVGHGAARDLAAAVVAGLEGAVVLSRVERSDAPVHRVARALASAIESEVHASRGPAAAPSR